MTNLGNVKSLNLIYYLSLYIYVLYPQGSYFDKNEVNEVISTKGTHDMLTHRNQHHHQQQII